MQKKLSIRKVLSILVAILMVTTWLAACSSGQGSSTAENSSSSQGTGSSTAGNNSSNQGSESSTAESTGSSGMVSDTPVTFTILYADNANFPFNADWATLKEMTKQTNVNLDVQVIPDSDYGTKVQLVMNSGTMPDIITKTGTNSGTIQELAMNGKLLAYSDYFNQMPNYEAQINNLNLTQELNNKKLSDGKIYELSQGVYGVKYANEQWFLRKDVFDSLNLPVPKTWDEVYNAAVKIKQKYPDAYPIQCEFNLADIVNMMAPSFDTKAGWGFGPSDFEYDFPTDKWILSATTDQYKQLLEYMNKIYNEGLLDKEFSTMSSSVFMQKCETNQGFIASAWFGQESTFNSEGKKTDPNTNWIPVAPFAGPSGTAKLGPVVQISSAMVSPATVKDKPYFNTMLKWLDWMFKPDGGAALFSWGIKGVTYETVDGKNQWMPGVFTGATDDLSKKYGNKNNCLSFIFPEDFVMNIFSPDEAAIVKEEADADAFQKLQPPMLLSSDQKDTEKLYSTALTDYISQMTEQFIMGKAPFSNWDDYVSQCKAKGADKLSALYNEVWAAQKNK